MTATSLRSAALAALVALSACGDGGAPPAVGTLERDRLDLVAEVSEPIVERPVEEGDFVEAGALLVRLDDARVRAQESQAASARDRAAARLAELERGPRSERITAARARREGAEGRLTTARRDFERVRGLVERGVASPQRLDEARASFDEALASRDATRARLDELEVGTTSEELAQARAALAGASAALADVRVRLARLEIRAPIAGWVDALPYELGEQPPAGGAVAVLLAGERPYARVYVPESMRVHVVPGTPALVHVDGLEAPLRGRVRNVARDAAFTPYFALTERDRGRLVYPAKVDLVDADARRLPSGVPVEVEFETDPVAARTDDGPRTR
ncbi:MAG TPA: HlyD family efflux transporter periplasmic adaptor subunit [Myxococcota bacterium]|nr:HlyD family efflux transporter periplasmic adaptor subunit [Myxococcota bacterium]